MPEQTVTFKFRLGQDVRVASKWAAEGRVAKVEALWFSRGVCKYLIPPHTGPEVAWEEEWPSLLDESELEAVDDRCEPRPVPPNIMALQECHAQACLAEHGLCERCDRPAPHNGAAVAVWAMENELRMGSLDRYAVCATCVDELTRATNGFRVTGERRAETNS